MKRQDAVIFCLAGDLPRMFAQVRQAMEQNGVSRIVAISSIEIYNNPVKAILRPYRALADAVEASGLDYTVIRPDWFTSENKVDYEITHKGEPEIPGSVSRKSIASYISDILFDENAYRQNVEISCPR